MTQFAIEKNSDPAAAVSSLLKDMLLKNLVDAVFVAARTPYSALPMPTLIADPEKMEGVDPLAPVAPFNAARQAVSILKHPAGKKLAIVLRPCELRALIELVKLNQCTIDDAVLISMDCLGRFEKDVYIQKASDDPDLTSSFYKNPDLRSEITTACSICEYFQPKGADLTISMMGIPEKTVAFIANTKKGEDLISELGLTVSDEPEEREETAESLLQKRVEARDALFRETAEQIKTIQGFQELIATCLNCYNCRAACPVCYCRECVFLTDVFAHGPETLLRRAAKRGTVKMPTDTTMFHMTRLIHMSHACVGCGHCSSVCPSDIPVGKIFRTVAAQTQALFDYEPGRDVDEPIPYLLFEEESDKK